jgi:linoleoyl-CoA desaturase
VNFSLTLWSKFLALATVEFSRPSSDFFASLRKSVQNYFDEHQMSSAGNASLYWKAAILITAYIMVYVAALFLPVHWAVALLLAATLGFLQALVGFNIMHDACHDAFSTKKKVNYFFGLSMNALGTDAFMWRQKHNLVHHTYTNVDGIDDDIAKTPFLRMSASQPRFKAHRFQHVYLPFLYAISSLYWIVWKDFEDVFKGSRYRIEVEKMKAMDWTMFWTTKTIYFGLYFGLPWFVWGFWGAVLGFVVMHAMLGMTLSFVFQLAHVVENVEFEHAATDHTVIENEWAVHQLATTSDFAPHNKLVSWFLGGLNFQVEHHLFPRISHVHYPALQEIVQKTCKEYGIEYRYYPTTRKALVSHFRHMKRLGQA